MLIKMTNTRVHTVTLLAPPETLDRVHEMMDGIWIASPEISSEDQMSFETALIELMSNVFRHADSGKGITCTLTVRISEDAIDASISDTGESGDIKLTNTLMPDEFEESGRGFALIKALVHELSYERENEHNNWKITRRISK